MSGLEDFEMTPKHQLKTQDSETAPCFKLEQMRAFHLDEVEDDDRRPEALQHLVKMKASDVGIRVGLIHWGKIRDKG